MAVNNAMTNEFLHSAYTGESLAHMRYLTWADAAEKEGFPNIARLFRAISFAERVHAENHFKVIDGPTSDYNVTAGGVFGYNKTVDNLQGAINGELHESEQMYPVYLQIAESQGEKGAARTFHFALEAEKIHAKMFKEAQDSAREGKDINIKAVYICPVCGYTVYDEAPDKCPVCGAKKEVFKKF